MKKTFAQKVIDFNKKLNYTKALPQGFKVLNPYLDNPETLKVMELFYHKYYNDNNQRKLILGINPSRKGAGVTGVPFTDTKRLESVCGIKMESAYTHEVSSVFLYDMIAEFGGAAIFYANFYINSPFPLAILQQNKAGSWLNANYYDSNILFESLKEYMIESLEKHVSLGIDTQEVYVLGKKSADYVRKLNEEKKLFENIIALDHPRFIQQYKSKERDRYIQEYILTLSRRILEE